MQSVKRELRASKHHGKIQYQKAGGNSSALNWMQISNSEQEQAGGGGANKQDLSSLAG